MKSEKFKTWEEAFDFCSEKDVPVFVKVDLKTLKIYPSEYNIPIHKSGGE